MQYYTPAVLELAGFRDNRTALLVAMLPAAVNSVGTLFGMWQIDKCGRRCGRYMGMSLHALHCIAARRLLLATNQWRHVFLLLRRSPDTVHVNNAPPDKAACKCLCGRHGVGLPLPNTHTPHPIYKALLPKPISTHTELSTYGQIMPLLICRASVNQSLFST